MIGKEHEAEKIAEFVAKALKIERNSLCFCTSGRKFKHCCGRNIGSDLTFLEDELKAGMAYKKAKGEIKGIPAGIWKKLEQGALGRFNCLFPGCRDKTVSCHLIPENILRASYGSFCSEYRMDSDSGGWHFYQVGVGKANCLPVFCSYHDNELFKKIDPMVIDFSSQEQLFLLAFKALAFCIRKNQYLASIASQVEIFRPFWIQELYQLPNGSNVTIDLSKFQTAYTRFLIQNGFWKRAVRAYKNKDWDFFSYFHRVVPSPAPIFYATFTNPLHDLEGKRINTPEQPIATTATMFTKDGYLHILLSPTGGQSKTAYEPFLRQLEAIDDETFKTVINNIFTHYVETLLLPETFSLTDDDYNKINTARNYSASGTLQQNEILDLKNRDRAVEFIR